MTDKDNRLGHFLREVSNWTWLEFIKAEHDKSYTSNQAMIFALVRACSMRNLQAIRLATNRLDGKLATPLKIEYPKVFYLFPNAKLPEIQVGVDWGQPDGDKTAITMIKEDVMDVAIIEPEEINDDLATLSIRQTVTKMADYPRELPQAICNTAELIEQFVRSKGKSPMPGDNPAVKSVIAAYLLTMAAKRNVDALGEVFDQIDGKLAETFQVLGEDLYITNYSPTAPEGSYINANGIVEFEAIQVQDMWANKLGREMENGNR